MPNIIKPPSLKPGETIGIVAPAGPFDRRLFEKGVGVLEKMGFNVHIPPGLGRSERFLAGSDEHRARQINDCFGDDSIKGIFCARGGYGSLRLLDRIDFEMIGANPKVFVGFSDITAILSALFMHCRLVSFHGPVLTRLGEADEKTLGPLTEAISPARTLELRFENGQVIKTGRCEGVVAGGNLTTLCHLLGTPYQPDFNGCILLLEDIAEAPYKIDRKLFQMKMSGSLEGVAGVVLGDFIDCGAPGDLLATVRDIFKAVQIPIVAGFHFGHGPVNITVPMGLPAILDTAKRSLCFMEPATKM